jgi:hypothetical protein
MNETINTILEDDLAYSLSLYSIKASDIVSTTREKHAPGHSRKSTSIMAPGSVLNMMYLLQSFLSKFVNYKCSNGAPKCLGNS